ncbi:MAG: hypothetical protein JM58_08885 [Peptococcaceae bacterium BICA1-8]|nr:MAG: hypothetical protein JM58_08885 [Peptococcaceae bacterium BICA1-8]
MYFIYILECKDGTLYTGWTTNIEARLEKHNKGKGAKYTRTRLPVTLKYYEVFETKTEAMQREAIIKKMTRLEKYKIIESNPLKDEGSYFEGNYLK